MSVVVIITDRFKRDAKKLLKKYQSLKTELADLAAKLIENPYEGIKITERTYKIRLAVKSKGKGKSGGMRVITYVYEISAENDKVEVYLLSIYDKSNYSNISDGTLRGLISEIEIQKQVIDNKEDEYKDKEE